MKIIDLTAGKRAQWFNKKHPDCLFLDIRSEVAPDLVADARELSPDLGVFDLIVFDPPHCNMGAGSDMAATYGHFTISQIRELIEKVGAGALTISHPGTIMALKWNNHDMRLRNVLDLLPGWEPLIGHQIAGRIKRKSETFWVLLRPDPSPVLKSQTALW